ncbi:hypothetical protein H6F86_21060 [Phormidium sp. FACHB-592]|uniref:50S ribosomal protein L29 n=1 Tax=Stenomitos frigidus AS-A4 TaxID=2933935 RepID=A0ABV0KES3_9CYAN|nr:hypothetical protein [Phormidium sp. FACHB-592]MBD2076325.1 hypothetical protein [Phormidium sp. FACHB-592]
MKRTKRQATIEVLKRAITGCDSQVSALTGFDDQLARETKELKKALTNRLTKLLIAENKTSEASQ